MAKPRVQFLTRLSLDTYDMLKRAASEQRRPMNEIVETALREYAKNSVLVDEVYFDEWYGDITHYTVGRSGDRYFFRWTDSAEDEVPGVDVDDADNGISWHSSKKEALTAARECFEAAQQTSDDPLWAEFVGKIAEEVES